MSSFPALGIGGQLGTPGTAVTPFVAPGVSAPAQLQQALQAVGATLNAAAAYQNLNARQRERADVIAAGDAARAGAELRERTRGMFAAGEFDDGMLAALDQIQTSEDPGATITAIVDAQVAAATEGLSDRARLAFERQYRDDALRLFHSWNAEQVGAYREELFSSLANSVVYAGETLDAAVGVAKENRAGAAMNKNELTRLIGLTAVGVAEESGDYAGALNILDQFPADLRPAEQAELRNRISRHYESAVISDARTKIGRLTNLALRSNPEQMRNTLVEIARVSAIAADDEQFANRLRDSVRAGLEQSGLDWMGKIEVLQQLRDSVSNPGSPAWNAMQFELGRIEDDSEEIAAAMQKLDEQRRWEVEPKMIEFLSTGSTELNGYRITDRDQFQNALLGMYGETGWRMLRDLDKLARSEMFAAESASDPKVYFALRDKLFRAKNTDERRQLADEIKSAAEAGYIGKSDVNTLYQLAAEDSTLDFGRTDIDWMSTERSIEDAFYAAAGVPLQAELARFPNERVAARRGIFANPQAASALETFMIDVRAEWRDWYADENNLKLRDSDARAFERAKREHLKGILDTYTPKAIELGDMYALEEDDR